jgi:hypothetical protein
MNPLKKYHLHKSFILLLAICHLQFTGGRDGISRLLYPGCITTANQVVTAPSLPAPIIATSASGGSCDGNYIYQWMVYESGFYIDIPGATGQNLTFISTFQALGETESVAPGLFPSRTKYYMRRATCGSEVKYTAPVSIRWL